MEKEMKKLDMEDMNAVAGGTSKECSELEDALRNYGHNWNLGWREGWRRGLTMGLSQAFSTGAIEEVLDGMGIKADCSKGLLGIGSKNNVYKDKKTGMNLLHSEVIEYIKTGRKSWE